MRCEGRVNGKLAYGSKGGRPGIHARNAGEGVGSPGRCTQSYSIFGVRHSDVVHIGNLLHARHAYARRRLLLESSRAGSSALGSTFNTTVQLLNAALAGYVACMNTMLQVAIATLGDTPRDCSIAGRHLLRHQAKANSKIAPT